jgi:tRNA pseudouridine38-40 synthase
MKRTLNRFLLGVQYKGGGYRGSTHVGEYICHALKEFNGEENFENFTGSSRTDSKVHALRNVWHVDLHLKEDVAASERRGEVILRALNHYLRNQDIVITDCVHVPSSFECRSQAKYRTYMYRLIGTPSLNFKRNLFQNKYAWNVPSLNVDEMQTAANHLIGIHDFSTFRNSGCQSRSPYRHLWSIDVCSNNSDDRLRDLGRDDVRSDPFLLVSRVRVACIVCPVQWLIISIKILKCREGTNWSPSRCQPMLLCIEWLGI